VDGQGQHFPTPKIPNLAGAIAKGHATASKAVHHNRVRAILSGTGFRAVVLHAATRSRIETIAMNIFCHFCDKNCSAISILVREHYFLMAP
jgi:hypothetical protein